MRTLKKRILAVALTAMAAATMAMPSFADWHIEADDNTGRYLNIAGTLGSSPNKRYLSLYRTSAPNSDQTFVLMKKSGTSKDNYVLCSTQNTLYAMNRTSGGRAWMWNLQNNGYNDSRLKTPTSDSAGVLVSYYYGNIGYSGSNIYFGSGTSNWFVSGTPTLPLNSNSVATNPYI